MTVMLVLATVALVLTMASAMGAPVPLWVAVLPLCLIELLRALPVGK